MISPELQKKLDELDEQLEKLQLEKLCQAADLDFEEIKKRRGRPPKDDGEKVSNWPRLNIALSPDMFDFVNNWSDFLHLSASDYIRRLIEEDRKKSGERLRIFETIFRDSE